jgi:hypothetical protein
MDMVSQERDSDVSGTSPRGSECKSGLGIQGSDRSQRLEIESNPVPGTFTEMGALGGRSVCISTDMPITTVCELETRPMVHSNRFLFNELAENERVCIPPICLNRSMPAPGNVPEGRTVGSSGSCMASTTLVPSTIAISSRLAFPISDVS